MKVAIGAVIGGVVAYIVCNQLITALVVGTTTGDTLIQTVGPIVLAAMVILIILRVGNLD